MKWGHFRSGAVWMMVFTLSDLARAMPTGVTERMATAPTDPHTAAALVEGKVWVTRDGGERWALADLKEGELEETALESDWSDPDTADAYPIDTGEPPADSPFESSSDEPSAPDEDDISLDRRYKRITRSLAVSDTGVWALATATHLIAGSTMSHARHRIALFGVVGLLFDSEERLLVLTAHELEMFGNVLSDERPIRQWRFTDAVAVVKGPAPNRAVVLDAQGLWQVSTEGDAKGPTLLKRIAAGSAVAPEMSRSADGAVMGYIVASMGTLQRVRFKGTSLNNPSMRIGVASSSVTEVLVDKKGEIRVHSSRDGWSVWQGNGFRPLLGYAMVVDAAGGFWIGTDSGPKPPPKRADAAISPSSYGPMPLSVPEYALTDPFPRPPRCRKLGVNPLPTVKAFAGAHQGTGRWLETPPRQERRDLGTGVVFGIALTWTFEPIEPGACLERWQTFRQAKSRREERAAFLLAGWLDTSVRQDNAQNIREAILRRMEMEKLRHLMGVLGARFMRRR